MLAGQTTIECTHMQGMIRRFVDARDLWVGAVEAVADLDALMSLAAHALHADGSVCRPKLVAPPHGAPPVFEAKGLRHPSGTLRSDPK